jgi:hypothetical protein
MVIWSAVMMEVSDGRKKMQQHPIHPIDEGHEFDGVLCVASCIS